MPWPVAYIANVEVPPAVEAKILNRNITAAEVREAVVLTKVLRSRWNWNPDRGWRLFVVGLTYAHRAVKVVVFPVDELEGEWRLCTALVATPKSGA